MHRPIASAAIGLLLVGWLVAVVDWLRRAEQVPPVPWLTWTTPEGRAVLESWGVSATGWAGFLVLLALAVVAASMVAAWLLLREPASPFRSYTAVALVLFATAGGHVSVVAQTLHPGLGEVGSLLQGLAWLSLYQLAYLYPDGRFVPRWSRWAVLGWVAFLVTGLVVDVAGLRRPPWDLLETLLLLGLLTTAVVAQVQRYRHVSGPVERTQTRGVLAALALWAALGLILVTTPLQDLVRSPTSSGMLASVVVEVLTTATVGLIPLAVATGILRRRAVVVSQLGRRLAEAVLPDQVAEQLVDTVGQSLRLPRVMLRGPGGLVAVHRLEPEERPGPVKDADGPPVAPVSFPIRYLGEHLGELEVVPGPRGLAQRERELLAEVASQAAVAIRAAATTGMLRAARERLVAAREEERRRLHRDLHDGLGPTLAGLYQRLDLAGTLLDTDPAAAARLVVQARDHIGETIADLRVLVLGLRPPALDELGLVGVVEEGCHRLADTSGLRVEVAATRLPPLPAGVEVAAYRIVMEALTNVVRHAGATRCSVTLRAEPSELLVAVTDDGAGPGRGRGLAAPVAPGRADGGLATMRERAEDVGGTLEVQPAEPHGTRVVARLPLSTGSDEDPEWAP